MKGGRGTARYGLEQMETGRTLAELPFGIDRAERKPLADQLADGLRHAIETGRYRPGDTLPTIHEMCAAFGLSIRAPQAALKTLAAEGLIVSRRRLGSMVLERNATIWKGHVVLFQPDRNPIYYKTVIEMRMAEKLFRAGYMTTRVMLPFVSSRRPDFAPLAAILRQSTSLVLMHGDLAAGWKFLSRSGVPFAVVTERPCRMAGCVGSVLWDRNAAMGRFEDWCRREEVRSLLQIGSRHDSFLDMSRVRRAGVRVKSVHLVRRRNPSPGFEFIWDEVCPLFERLLHTGDWPDAILFTDDYITRAAVPLMLKHGVRIPDDVRVVSWANVGNRQLFSVPMPLMEMNPFADAEKICDAVLAYLENGIFPSCVSIDPSFRE